VHIPQSLVGKPDLTEIWPGCLIDVEVPVKKVPACFVNEPGLIRYAAE
jgi:hypothetical protein